MKKILRRDPTHRMMYFIASGDRVGGFIVRIREHDTEGAFAFLFMPSPTEALYISKAEARDALRNKMFKSVRKIPQPVYDVMAANWRVYAKEQGLI